MFSKFDDLCQKVIINSKKEMVKLKHPYVGTEHFLLAVLNSKNAVSIKLNELNVFYDSFFNNIVDLIGYGNESNDWFIFTPLLKSVMENATLESKENNNGVVDIELMFLSLLEQGDGVAVRTLTKMGVNVDLLYKYFANLNSKNSKLNLSLTLLDKFGYNLTLAAKNNKLDPVFGRQEELDNMIEILLVKNKNNPLLIGDAGVGKTAIVEELARKIAIGDVPVRLKNKEIISLSMSALVSGTKYRGEFEERVNKIIKEAESNDNIILFIDEIHTLVGAGGAEGAIDAANILKPYLARGSIKLIGATTIDEYKKYIEKERALSRRFQVIYVEEPSIDDTYKILLNSKKMYEEFHNVKISDDVLKQLVLLCDKYIYNKKQPDKSIDVLDEVCSKISNIKNKNGDKLGKLQRDLDKIISFKNTCILNNEFGTAIEYKNKQNVLEDKINKLTLKFSKVKDVQVTIQDIIAVIEKKSNTIIYEYKNVKRDKLARELTNNIIGQDDAINKLVKFNNSIVRGFRNKNKPISLLFVGPSGCGKTALAQSYNEYLLDKRNFIRLDMSEFKEAHSISKLIGAPAGYVGYDDNNYLLDDVRLNPFSLILLDEIEKAHHDVINLFLQILDNGKIKSSSGKEIRFDNCIIIMTSNLGFGSNGLGFVHQKNNVSQKLREFFAVEFLNRIDNIIIFNTLTKHDIQFIVKKQLKEVLKGVPIDHKSEYNCNKIVNNIVAKSKYEIYGAREVNRLIYEEINRVFVG